MAKTDGHLHGVVQSDGEKYSMEVKTEANSQESQELLVVMGEAVRTIRFQHDPIAKCRMAHSLVRGFLLMASLTASPWNVRPRGHFISLWGLTAGPLGVMGTLVHQLEDHQKKLPAPLQLKPRGLWHAVRFPKPRLVSLPLTLTTVTSTLGTPHQLVKVPPATTMAPGIGDPTLWWTPPHFYQQRDWHFHWLASQWPVPQGLRSGWK